MSSDRQSLLEYIKELEAPERANGVTVVFKEESKRTAYSHNLDPDIRCNASTDADADADADINHYDQRFEVVSIKEHKGFRMDGSKLKETIGYSVELQTAADGRQEKHPWNVSHLDVVLP